MDPIREAHLSEPGLLVIDVAGRDDATVFALQGRDRPPVGLLDRRAPPGTSASPVFGCGRSAAGPRGGLPAGAGADGHVERRGPPSRGGWRTRPHPRCHTRPRRAWQAAEVTVGEERLRANGRLQVRVLGQAIGPSVPRSPALQAGLSSIFSVGLPTESVDPFAFRGGWWAGRWPGWGG
ncbi:DUF6207 family protein [Streptomyces althioticus]|uniref:DUF6207 family protein n=1 Tax=Streptomyces TaxID=1883 RepID=UPI0033327DBD